MAEALSPPRSQYWFDSAALTRWDSVVSFSPPGEPNILTFSTV